MTLLSNIWQWTQPKHRDEQQADPQTPRTLLIGNAMTLRQLHATLTEAAHPPHTIGCIVVNDPAPNAIGVPVLGDLDQLPMLAHLHRIQRVLICLPRAKSKLTESILAQCREISLPARTLPTIDDLLTTPTKRPTPAIDLAQLLDRAPRQLDEPAIAALLRNKRIMVTGAGGSIGSELSHIIARYQPAELQLMERAENNLFQIHRTLREQHPDLTTHAILHDVTIEQRTRQLCEQHRPQIIFHAAAHKHVPMMEDHPRAAVENNLFGTLAIAEAAHVVGAERFVMISSDKAVNPTSVMGATKRLAEMAIQSLNSQSRTAFTMVRFGNVLGSACSVVPIWTQQLTEGRPLTVTDPRMTRYFMTIPEAAALVIQAATLEGNGGQVMLLDMGDPIRIVDMAERFVRAHGLEPQTDVPITYTGTRPGEKLFEELAYDSEAMQPTAHDAVRIWKTTPPDPAHMRQILDRFGNLRTDGDHDAIHQALRWAVPEMAQPDKPALKSA